MDRIIAPGAATLALLLATGAARAEIYVCEDNGRKTYSQQPCGDNAKAVELQQAPGRITLPDQFDGKAASDVCKIIVRSWEVAAQMRRQNIDMTRANERVFGYLRESVTNFDELARRNPQMFSAFQNASRQVTAGAYANPVIKPGEREAAQQECTRGIVQMMERSSPAAGTRRGGNTTM